MENSDLGWLYCKLQCNRVKTTFLSEAFHGQMYWKIGCCKMCDAKCGRKESSRTILHQ